MYQTKNKFLNKFTIDVLYFKGKNIKLSDNPIFLSFQVTKLGILSDEQVNKLLSFESTNLRLQCELNYLNDIVRIKKIK